MFGEGMVSFGTWSPVVTPDRYSKASPKIVCPSRTRSWATQCRGLEVEVTGLVVEVHRQLLVGRVDALELVDEVHVPRRATELAVGRGAHARFALEGHRVADRRVLGRPQSCVVEMSSPVPGPRIEQRGRSQQAADVVGTERWERARCHVSERTRTSGSGRSTRAAIPGAGGSRRTSRDPSRPRSFPGRQRPGRARRRCRTPGVRRR